MDPPQQLNPFGPGLGFDPAKPREAEKVITNTRLDLPGSAYSLEALGHKSHELVARPSKPSTSGRDVQFRVNQFKVKGWSDKDVWQYDILVGSGAEKKGKIMAVWQSKAVQNQIRGLVPTQMPFIWDGNKIAWSSHKIPEQRIMVDLDAEKGRVPRPGKEDKCYFIMRPTKTIRIASINSYLSGQTSFNNDVLESINFLDHVLRMGPSEKLLPMKRNFFSRSMARVRLDNVIEASKGVYASVRLCNPVSSLDGTRSTGLGINVDVANCTFWIQQDFHQAARNFCITNKREPLEYTHLGQKLRPVRTRDNRVVKSPSFKDLECMQKLNFTCKHRGGKENQTKVFKVKSFTWAPEHMEGANAKNVTFMMKDRQTGKEQEISVFDYYAKTYNIQLREWYLPLIETTRGGLFPMELCVLEPMQKYVRKLSGDQTSAMIKFAVTRPKERLQSIQQGLAMLNWQNDAYMKHYGIQVEGNMTMTKAKLLPNPEIMFGGNSKLNPGTTGRWDLRGKKMFTPNPVPLKTWGVCIVDKAVSVATAQNFFKVFVQTYIGHGGRVERKEPLIFDMGANKDIAAGVTEVRRQVGAQDRTDPQIIFFILPFKDSFLYERAKKNMECRYGLFSQMLNKAHVEKASPQYCSNVVMKVNAKLGGTTSKACTVSAPNQELFKVPTMIIGADVSHATPGSPQSSMAAITVSMDRFAGRYAATVQSNGYRVEMIQPRTWDSELMPLFIHWIKNVGGGNAPKHIYYFRDGVSEGQFSHVITEELQNLKAAINKRKAGAADNIKFTIIVCSKRHHIRFFPKDGDSTAGDRNGNVLPGTLVQHDCTHPFEHDFYLNSHSAIQGTARPVHYQVIYDDVGITADELHKLIYNHCYQYMRSTTPVSLFPAVYYAHLASNRARAHEPAPASDGPRGGQKFEELRNDHPGKYMASGASSRNRDSDAPPLLALGMTPTDGSAPINAAVVERIRTGMWYI